MDKTMGRVVALSLRLRQILEDDDVSSKHCQILSTSLQYTPFFHDKVDKLTNRI